MRWVSVRNAHGRTHLETRWSVAAAPDEAPATAEPVIAVDATHAA